MPYLVVVAYRRANWYMYKDSWGSKETMFWSSFLFFFFPLLFTPNRDKREKRKEKRQNKDAWCSK